jgi:ribokinase
MSDVRVAVVGHVEWVEFASVERVPARGEIVHASTWWEEPAGGGSVAAVQLTRLAGGCTFFTALGDDPTGHRARDELEALGVRMEVVWRRDPTRRAVTFVDAEGERTITTLGPRLNPHADDPLPWDELGDTDAVYFTAGDVAALRRARAARVLVPTTRIMGLLGRAGVHLNAVVGSARDPSERYEPALLGDPPGLVVLTEGAGGGSFRTADGRGGRYPPASPPGPVVDTYGGGDSFAAGLTFGLGAGMAAEDALALAARCGAWCVAGRGPYGVQLTDADL